VIPRVPGFALRGRRLAGARFFAIANYLKAKKSGRPRPLCWTQEPR
jgi:hypothetical protein